MEKIVAFIQSIYQTDAAIFLHSPVFIGNEKKYLLECIDSTIVSSTGKYIDQFEQELAKYTQTKKAVAVVNGTAALQVALKLVGVTKDHEVITQALTFVATVNAIAYIGAAPVFIDVDRDNMGLSPKALENFLIENAVLENNICMNKKTKKKIVFLL